MISLLRREQDLYDASETEPPALDMPGYGHPEALHGFYVVYL